MGSPEDSSIRDLEIKSLQNEAEWFVGCEIPKVGRRIKRILQHCLAFLSPRGAKELEMITDLVPADEDDDVIIPSMESANKLTSFETQDGLKGFISVGGWSITSAEITVRFPKWNKGVPHKATVNNTHAWRLYQLQNAYNFVKMTLNELNLLIQQCEAAQYKSQENPPSNPNSNSNINSNPNSNSNTNTNSNLNPNSNTNPNANSAQIPNFVITQQTALAAVNKVVGQVSKWMALARDSLMLPNKSLLFPYSLSHSQGFTGFHPALPQDLHIEFSICNSEIIISVYALHIGSGSIPLNEPSQKGPLGVSSPLPLHKPQNTSGTQKPKPNSDKSHGAPPLIKVDETNEGQGQDGGSDVPSISVAQPPASTSGDHRVTIGGTVYKTYQITQRGQPAWVAVLDQSEVHCIVPRVNHTLSLLTSAINALADIEDKLVALALL